MPWSNVEDIPPAIKSVTHGNLAAANEIAKIADGMKKGGSEVDNVWAVAIAQWRKMKSKKELMTGVKGIEDANGNKYIVLWTSNAFEDKEKEIFATKAWQDYVDRREVNGVKDRVWFWHVKGTDFATVEWQDMVGRILVEVAKVDNTEYGNKMFHALQHPDEYPDVLPQGWGTSHGYMYRAGDKEGGVYSFVEKYESTVLPAHRACNVYGTVKEVLDMAVRKDKKEGLAALVGDQLAGELLQDAEEQTDKLEQAGVKHKEAPLADGKKDEETEAAEDKVEDEETEAAEDKTDEQMYELELDESTVEEIAKEVVASKEFVTALSTAVKEAITSVKEELMTGAKEAAAAEVLSSKERIVQQALSGKLMLKPYTATKADDNITKREPAASGANDEKASQVSRLPGSKVVKSIVQGMVSGNLG